MLKEFHYSINPLSVEDKSLWNASHTLEEIRDNRETIMEQTLTEIPQEERHQWLLVDQLGILRNSLHDVYIVFKLTWLFTRKGRRRRVSRALRMMGVPLIKVKHVTGGIEPAEDGFEVVHIGKLKSIP